LPGLGAKPEEGMEKDFSPRRFSRVAGEGSWWDAFLSLLYPSPCRVCQGPLVSPRSLICGNCWDRIRLIEPPFCPRCGIPFPGGEKEIVPSDFQCGDCRRQEPPFYQARSLGYYEGTLREAIHLFKFGKRQELGSHLGSLMVEHFPADWDPSCIDLVLPIPLHPRRQRERGFNQSLLLARFLAASLEIHLQPRLMSRTRATLPQSDLPRSQKFENLKGAFEVRRPEEIANKGVLLVDDIMTSGATMREASEMLLEAGAEKVFVYTLARSVLH